MIFLKDVFNPVLKSKSTLWAHPLTKTDTGGSKPTLWPTTFCAQKHHFRKKKLNFPLPADLLPRLCFSSFLRSLSLSHPPQAPTPFSLQNGSLKAFDLWSLKNYASFDIQLVRPFSQPSNLAISYCTLSRNSTLSPHPAYWFQSPAPIIKSHGPIFVQFFPSAYHTERYIYIYIYRLVVFRSTPLALRASHWKTDNHVFRVTFFSLIFFLLSGLQCAQFPSFPPLIPHPNWYACIPFDLNFLFAVFGLFTSNSYACVDTLFRLFGYK